MRVENLNPGPDQEAAIAVTKAQRPESAERQHHHRPVGSRPHKCTWKRSCGLPSKEATNNGPPATTQTCLAYLKGMAREGLKEWRQLWGSIPQKGREYFVHFRLMPDKILQTDNRTLISTITQLRTGHGYFNSYPSKTPTSYVKTEDAATAAHLRKHQHTSS